MGININGTSVDKVVFNGTEVEKVIYNGTVVYTSSILEWNKVSVPTEKNLNGVTYGDGTFVAVGASGTILHSNNCNSWKKSTEKTQSNLYSVAFGEVTRSETKEVTTDSSGYALIDLIEAGIYGDKVTSISVTEDSSATTNIFFNEEDGREYLEINSSLTSKSINVVISFKINIFVAVGASGTALYSESYGYDWKYGGSGRNGTSTSYDLLDVAYGNGMFVAVGKSGTVLYSKDGRTWTDVTGSETNFDFESIICANGRFFITSASTIRYIVSTGTSKFTFSDKTVFQANVNAITHAEGRLIAIGKGTAAISTDMGASWSYHSISVDSFIYSMAYGNRMFVGVGTSGQSYCSKDGGTTFEKVETNNEKPLHDITYGHGKFVAVGSSGTLLVANH